MTSLVETPIRYPNIEVRLLGEDGNTFAILNRVAMAFREAGLPDDVFDDFHREATAGDYSHLLCTVMRWVHVPDVDQEHVQ